MYPTLHRPLHLAAALFLTQEATLASQDKPLIAASSPSHVHDSAGTRAIRTDLSNRDPEAALRKLFGADGYVPDLFRVVAWLPRDGEGWIKAMRGADQSQLRWGERFVYVTVFTDDETVKRDFVVSVPPCATDKVVCGPDSIEIRRSTLSYERPALLNRALTLLSSPFGVGNPKDERREGALRDTTAKLVLVDVGPLPRLKGDAPADSRHLFVAHFKFALAEESRSRVSVRAPTTRRFATVDGMTLDFENGSSLPFNVGLAVGATFNAKVGSDVSADSGDVIRSGQRTRVGLYPFLIWYPLRRLQPALPWRTFGVGLVVGTSVKPSGIFEEFLVGGSLRLGLNGVHLLGAANFIPVVEARQLSTGKFTKEHTREVRFLTGLGFEF